MLCPECGRKTNVKDSRPFGKNSIRRQRECFRCHHTFFTFEFEDVFLDPHLERDGTAKPYSPRSSSVGLREPLQADDDGRPVRRTLTANPAKGRHRG